jgi:hypothetical protein
VSLDCGSSSLSILSRCLQQGSSTSRSHHEGADGGLIIMPLSPGAESMMRDMAALSTIRPAHAPLGEIVSYAVHFRKAMGWKPSRLQQIRDPVLGRWKRGAGRAHQDVAGVWGLRAPGVCLGRVNTLGTRRSAELVQRSAMTAATKIRT